MMTIIMTIINKTIIMTECDPFFAILKGQIRCEKKVRAKKVPAIKGVQKRVLHCNIFI